MFSNNIDSCNLIDFNSSKRNGQQKIFCVLCNNEKIQLDLVNEEENRYKCPRCKNTYQPNFEILPEEDELISSHESENEGPLLLSAEYDNEFKSTEDNDTSKSDIKLPKYLQDSETTTITYFREE